MAIGWGRRRAGIFDAISIHPPGRGIRASIRRLTVLALAGFLLGMSLAQPASAAPTTCRVGAYIVSISKVDTAAGTFSADFWLWSICPVASIQPLKTMEFVNAVSVNTSLDSTLQRGNEWWSNRKVSGVFRQRFSLEDYPFDAENLTIRIEEGILDTRDLVYASDDAQSRMDPRVAIPGWKLGKLQLSASRVHYPTTFGDPTLTGASSDYAGLTLRIDSTRSYLTNYIKTAFPIYIAILLALVSLVVTDGRTGLCGGSLFAVVLSFVSVDSVIGPHDGMYLLDQLHVCALLTILFATGWGVYTLARRGAGGDPAVWIRRDRLAALIMLGAFVVINAAIIILNVAIGPAS